jgi:predicted nucleic acid-binding protein
VALVVLDTSIVIAFLDPNDALHEAAVQALADRQYDELIVPASAYAEMLVGPYRSGAKAVAAFESFLADFAIRIEPITATIARAAARLRGRSKSLRLPDALVLATADELGAEMVLTGDASWARSRRVKVIRARDRR